jgi:hypothetical protein
MAKSQAGVSASVIFGFQRGKGLIEKLVQFLIVLGRVSLEFAAKVGRDLEVERHSPSTRNPSAFCVNCRALRFFVAA